MEKEIKELLNKIKKTELDDFLDSEDSIELIIEILRRYEYLGLAVDHLYNCFYDVFQGSVEQDIGRGMYALAVEIRKDYLDELKRSENKNNPYFQEYFDTVKKLINDCEILYNKLSDDGIPIPFDIERALFESIGRLTINDNSAIRFLEEFIEEQKE